MNKLQKTIMPADKKILTDSGIEIRQLYDQPVNRNEKPG